MADERPADLETKDTRGTLLGYIPSVVPHENRTGSELTDDERKRADDRLRDDNMTGVPEADHKASQFTDLGANRGEQDEPALGKTEDAGTTPAPKRTGKS